MVVWMPMDERAGLDDGSMDIPPFEIDPSMGRGFEQWAKLYTTPYWVSMAHGTRTQVRSKLSRLLEGTCLWRIAPLTENRTPITDTAYCRLIAFVL
jgi:hypothetical protein